MTKPSGGGMDDRYEREGTPHPLIKEQIEGHISAIKSIIKDYNRQNKDNTISLDLEQKYTSNDRNVAMWFWCRMFQQTLNTEEPGAGSRVFHSIAFNELVTK
ncbi:hypothetical protein Tco_0915807 [Tanacetum coccineum]